MHWESRGRNISAGQQSRHIALQHSGLYEVGELAGIKAFCSFTFPSSSNQSTEFLCVAENEAGRSVQKVFVLVTGPSQPERIRYHVDGNSLVLQWEEPRITNGPMADYEVHFTAEDPSLPNAQWQVQQSGGPLERALTLAGLQGFASIILNTVCMLMMICRREHRLHGEDPRPEPQRARPLQPAVHGQPIPSTSAFSQRSFFFASLQVRTWLAARPPTAKTSPEGRLERRPSQEELEVNCEASLPISNY